MSYPQVWSTFKTAVNQDWFTDSTSSAHVYATREMQCLLAEKGGRQAGRKGGKEGNKSLARPILLLKILMLLLKSLELCCCETQMQREMNRVHIRIKP